MMRRVLGGGAVVVLRQQHQLLLVVMNPCFADHETSRQTIAVVVALANLAEGVMIGFVRLHLLVKPLLLVKVPLAMLLLMDVGVAVAAEEILVTIRGIVAVAVEEILVTIRGIVAGVVTKIENQPFASKEETENGIVSPVVLLPQHLPTEAEAIDLLLPSRRKVAGELSAKRLETTIGTLLTVEDLGIALVVLLPLGMKGPPGERNRLPLLAESVRRASRSVSHYRN